LGTGDLFDVVLAGMHELKPARFALCLVEISAGIQPVPIEAIRPVGRDEFDQHWTSHSDDMGDQGKLRVVGQREESGLQ
jgi:hypothetical protein